MGQRPAQVALGSTGFSPRIEYRNLAKGDSRPQDLACAPLIGESRAARVESNWIDGVPVIVQYPLYLRTLDQGEGDWVPRDTSSGGSGVKWSWVRPTGTTQSGRGSQERAVDRQWIGGLVEWMRAETGSYP